MKDLLLKLLGCFADFSITLDENDNPIIPAMDPADIESAIEARDKATDEQKLLLQRFEFYRLLNKMHGELLKAASMHYGQRKDVEVRIRSGRAFSFRAFKGIDLRNLKRPICCPHCVFIDCQFDGEILEGSNLEGVVIEGGMGSVRIARRSRLRNMDSIAIMRKEECLEDQEKGFLDRQASSSLLN